MTERLERERLTKIEQATPEKVYPVVLSKEANVETPKDLESMEVIDDFDPKKTPTNPVETTTGALVICNLDDKVVSKYW